MEHSSQCGLCQVGATAVAAYAMHKAASGQAPTIRIYNNNELCGGQAFSSEIYTASFASVRVVRASYILEHAHCGKSWCRASV